MPSQEEGLTPKKPMYPAYMDARYQQVKQDLVINSLLGSLRDAINKLREGKIVDAYILLDSAAKNAEQQRHRIAELVIEEMESRP